MAIELEKIDPSDLKTLWKKGTTLYTAQFDFVDNKLLSEYIYAKKQYEQALETPISQKSGGLERLSESLRELSNINRLLHIAENVLNELKLNVLNKILSERLIGLGYELPISFSGTPQLIPLHVWPNKTGTINWDDSTFLNNDIEIVNIKIIKVGSLKKITQSKNNGLEIKLPNLISNGNTGGRPTIKELIIDAYESLKTAEKIDFSITLKPHTQLIQEAVRILNSDIQDNKNMSYKTIYSHLGAVFNKDKKEYEKRL